MTEAALLPNRRTEAWKYSDLRAALGETTPVLREGRDIIERLAGRSEDAAVGAGEQRLLVERLDSDAALEAHAAEWTVASGGCLTRVVMQSGAGVTLSMFRVHLEAGAAFRQFVLTEGGKLARIETHIDAAGADTKIEINGVYLCNSGRHADLTSVIDHRERAGQTRQLIKGVTRKRGRGVFQGKIVVERAAQKTDARQYHHGMLLEEGAEIFAKPELMIHADDVQCAHGNTAGGLDERALFYMRSRGVPEAEARALLIESFLVEAVPDGLPDDLNDELTRRIRVWLRGGAQ